MIVPFRRRRADQEEALRREPRDRELAQNSALGVERPGQRDAALFGQAAADEAIEPGFRARALDDQLGEAAEIEQADALAHRLAFLRDRIEEAGLRAAEARLRLAGSSGRGK